MEHGELPFGYTTPVWRHALAPEPRAARQGLESGHTLIVYVFFNLRMFIKD